MKNKKGFLILLVIFAMVATPLVEKQMLQARTERLISIGVIAPEPEPEAPEETGVP